MTAAGGNPSAGGRPRSSPAERRPAPAPMLGLAIGLMVGIAAGYWSIERPAWAAPAWLPYGLAAVSVLLVVGPLMRRRRPLRAAPGRKRAAIAIGAAVVAGAAGFLRSASEVMLPVGHVQLALGPAGEARAEITAVVETTPRDSPVRDGNRYIERPASRRATFTVRIETAELTHDVDSNVAERAGDRASNSDRNSNSNSSRSSSGVLRVTLPLPKDFAAVDLRLAPGDRVRLIGRLTALRGPGNPGEVDWAAVLWQQRIDARLRLDGPEGIRRSDSAATPMQRFRAWWRSVARRALLDGVSLDEDARSARLLDAMVLGQRSATERDLDEIFTRAGAIHVLSVSGFHVSVLMVGGFLLAQITFRRSRIARALFVLTLLAAYVLLAETNAPLVRTAIGVTLLVAGGLLNRAVAPLNWLSLAAILILLWSPRELFRPGFQLSFLQVAFLLTAGDALRRLVIRRRPDTASVARLALRRSVDWILLSTLVSAGAWLIAMPLVLWHFERFAPWGALGALVAAVPTTLLLWASFVGLVWNAVPGLPGATFLSALIRGLTDATLEVVGWVARLPRSNIDIAQRPPLWLVIGTVIAMGAGLIALRELGWRRRSTRRGETETGGTATPGTSALREGGPSEESKRTPAAGGRLRVGVIAGMAAVGLAWALWAAGGPAADDRVRMDVLAVGGGSAIVISQPDGAGVLINAGGWDTQGVAETVTRTARVRGVARWSAMYVTSPSPDAYAAIPTLLSGENALAPASQARRTMLVFVPPDFSIVDRSRGARRWLSDMAAWGASVTDLTEGQPHTIDDVTIEPLWPPAEPLLRARGANPMAVRVSAAGGSVCIVGTASPAVLNALAARAKAHPERWRSEVLVAGSGVTQDSAGPLLEVARFVGARHIIVQGTAEQGAIALESGAASLMLELWRTPATGAVSIGFAAGRATVVQTGGK